MKKFLHDALIANHHVVSQDTEKKFIAYLDLLSRWNQIMNLTAIQDEKDSVLLHLLDSLSIKDYLHGTRILDVGTGAGLPGIPLALVCPDKQFVLLDSNNKKIHFLRQVMYELSIPNVEIIHARCEDFKPQKLFDSILSRAFARIQVMLETTEHLQATHGQFLLMKGVYPEQEIREIPARFSVQAVHELHINGLAAKRHLVVIVRSLSSGKNNSHR